MNKKKKTKRFELRLTEEEFNKLSIRAGLYAGGNISRLIRHWIKKAPIKKLKEKI